MHANHVHINFNFMFPALFVVTVFILVSFLAPPCSRRSACPRTISAIRGIAIESQSAAQFVQLNDDFCRYSNWWAKDDRQLLSSLQSLSLINISETNKQAADAWKFCECNWCKAIYWLVSVRRFGDANTWRNVSDRSFREAILNRNILGSPLFLPPIVNCSQVFQVWTSPIRALDAVNGPFIYSLSQQCYRIFPMRCQAIKWCTRKGK